MKYCKILSGQYLLIISTRGINSDVLRFFPTVRETGYCSTIIIYIILKYFGNKTKTKDKQRRLCKPEAVTEISAVTTNDKDGLQY